MLATTRRAAVATAAVATIVITSGCGTTTQGPEPYASFDTATNVITVDATVTDKHHAPARPDEGLTEESWIFTFVIGKGAKTSTTDVWVSHDLYTRTQIGDRVRLRCDSVNDPCVTW